MKFKFSLETLLRHRKSLEQKAMGEMIKSQRALELAQRDLNNLYGSIDNARDIRLESEISALPKSESLPFFESFIDGQKLRIEDQKQVIREKQTEFEMTQEEYRKAAIALKTVERLKEKQLQEFKVKKGKNDQKKLDEMILLRFTDQGDL